MIINIEFDKNLGIRPILVIPKQCTKLTASSEIRENIWITVKVLTPDTEGKDTNFYEGYLQVKIIDTDECDNAQYSDSIPDYYDSLPIIFADPAPSYNENEVWIDPTNSQYIYNSYGLQQPEAYTVQEQHKSIAVEQYTTYVTNNVYDCNNSIQCSLPLDVEVQSAKDVTSATGQTIGNKYEADEYESGVFLSQLPEKIMNENHNKAREEIEFIATQTEDSALKQLMSPGIQSMSKQRKTILYLGPDSHSGQTIQQIGYYDQSVECSGDPGVDNEVVIEDKNPPRQKRYQCAQCHQIFDQIGDFREHMTNHSSPSKRETRSSRQAKGPMIEYEQSIDRKQVYNCGDCGRDFKTKAKFDKHCAGHGDPDLECSRCRRVFASKFTLRAHLKLHERKFPCKHCTRAFDVEEAMRAHLTKAHSIYMCDYCDFECKKKDELMTHQESHDSFAFNSSDTDLPTSIFDDITSDDALTFLTSEVMSSPDPDWTINEAGEPQLVTKDEKELKIKEAESVIAKVMCSDMFLTDKPCGSGKRYRKCKKVCEVCLKSFDRISDLKRHLIEHVVKSTLSKNSVTHDGTLNLQCEICQVEMFNRIDRYKAHLREHAKLTLYKCTFCNKSFSDSSNFSKHKKIHSAQYYQCDLCHRKFNSKKMLTRHIDYHNSNQPLHCDYCDKVFYFKSMLNKHVQSAHKNQAHKRFRCQFCRSYFKSLKDKWDHEWVVHNARKMVVDCEICGAQFRKYAELKRHCGDIHGVDIPRAKKLFMNK